MIYVIVYNSVYTAIHFSQHKFCQILTCLNWGKEVITKSRKKQKLSLTMDIFRLGLLVIGNVRFNFIKTKSKPSRLKVQVTDNRLFVKSLLAWGGNNFGTGKGERAWEN